MNENEIKDLTNIIKNHCDNTPDEDCVGIGCDECEARALINAGYRKVADDEIVESMKTYERARQETAREILQELKNRQTLMLADEVFGRETVVTQKINELAKKYDIELEG